MGKPLLWLDAFYPVVHLVHLRITLGASGTKKIRQEGRGWLDDYRIGERIRRLWALFHPFVSSRVRWKSKKDGLWVKNTENAPRAASAMEYTTFSPVR